MADTQYNFRPGEETLRRFEELKAQTFRSNVDLFRFLVNTAYQQLIEEQKPALNFPQPAGK